VKKIMLAATVGLVALTGCLPIELDVTDDGKVLVPRGEGFYAYDPATGKATQLYDTNTSPAFAIDLPGDAGFVAVSQTDDGGMGMNLNVERIDAAGKAKSITSASNITYAQVSRDGKRLSLTRLADQQSEGFDQNLPELSVVSTGGGAVTKLVSNVGITHRWMPDSKSMVALKLDEKDNENNQYTGRIVTVDADSGKLTDMASVIGPQGVYLDLSPDGKKVLFTAHVAGKAGANLVPPGGENQQPPLKLFELDLSSGDVKEAWPEAQFGIYSPKQTKVLVGGTGRNGMRELTVTNAKFVGQTVVANDAAEEVGGMGATTSVYPSWFDDDTVLYLANQPVYGTAGKNLMLTTVKANGSQRTSHQARIDAAAAQ